MSNYEVKLYNHIDNELKHYLKLKNDIYELFFSSRIYLINIETKEYENTFYSFNEIQKQFKGAKIAVNVHTKSDYLTANYVPIKNIEIYTCDEWRKR